MSAHQPRRVLAGLIAAITTVLAAGLLSGPSQAYVAAWVDQVGTYDALTSPNYTGIVPVQSFINGQTLGIGTFDHLDGELVMVGGIAYRVGTDGTPRPVSSSITTPFFETIAFTPDWSGPVAPGTSCANLVGAVNKLAQTDTGVIQCECAAPSRIWSPAACPLRPLPTCRLLTWSQSRPSSSSVHAGPCSLAFARVRTLPG